MYQYFLAHKPYGMLTQFTDHQSRPTLAQLNYAFSKDVYPVGRLDKDSEGLLLLTNNPKVNKALLSPKHHQEKEYYAQVEGAPTLEDLAALTRGVQLKTHFTKPAKVAILGELELPPRNPPIRYRASIPTTWISLCLTEGKNRQVRRMTAHVGFPTLRLIRMRIAHLELGDLAVNEVRALTQSEQNRLLKTLKL